MRYKTADAFRTALDDRLKSRAAQDGVALSRLRKKVAFERWLARLAVVAPNPWVLKGAFALDLRLGVGTRATKDVDLSYQGDVEGATREVMSVQELNIGDFFTFAVRRTPALDKVVGVRAVRYSVSAELAGRRFEQFPVDVVLVAQALSAPDLLRGSDLLTFAGIERIEIPVVPLDQHIAEKIHAYTGTYGPTARPSTRTKDLVDLVLIANLATVDAHAVRRRLERLFAGRGGQSLPPALPSPPANWEAAYARLAVEVGMPPEIEAGYADASAFLDPVLDRTGAGQWDPGLRRWHGPATATEC